MSHDYNPNSLDAALARIESRLCQHADSFEAHVSSTQQYRKELNEEVRGISSRVTELEGDKKKMVGIAAGAGVASAGFGHAILKLFGGGGQ